MLFYFFLFFFFFIFFFNDTATTEIYTLSLHDALPISLIDRLAHLVGGGHARVVHEREDAAADQRQEQQRERQPGPAPPAAFAGRRQLRRWRSGDCRPHRRVLPSVRARRDRALGRLERGDEVVGAGVALLRLLGEGFQHHGLERRVDALPQRRETRHRFAQVLERDRHRAVALEGHAATEHLVEDHPDRVEIGRGCHAVPLRLLW